MLDDLRQWAGPWGDLASVTGLFLAFVGFFITIAGVYRSKSAAQRARAAADEMMKELFVGARRKGYGVEQAIDNLLERLE